MKLGERKKKLGRSAGNIGKVFGSTSLFVCEARQAEVTFIKSLPHVLLHFLIACHASFCFSRNGVSVGLSHAAL